MDAQTSNQTQHLMALVEFSSAMLDWCNQETARSINAVVESIGSLNDQSRQLVEPSEDIQQAIDAFIRAVKHGLADDAREPVSSTMLSILQQKVTHSNDLQAIIDPAIHAIQFEDRVRQNIENMIKMIQIWIQTREEVTLTQRFSEEDKKAFGQKVMDNFVMQEERDIIKQHIPGLDDNMGDDDIVLF